MALTEKRRELRAQHVGASDSPALLGHHPQRNAADVFFTKGEYRTRDEPADYMQIGDWLEGPLLDFAAEKLDVKIDRRGSYRVSKGPDGGVLATNLDGPIVDRAEAIEGKYVGAKYAQDWGPEGTDDIPAGVVIQCQHQIYVAELDRVHVAVAIASYSLERRLYVVERHDALIDAIVDAGVRFWHDYVLAGVCPPDVLPKLDTLKALVRVPDKVVEVPKALVMELDRARAARSFVNRQVEQVEAAMLTALDDAEAGDYGDKDKWVTCFRVNRKAYSVPAGSYPKLLHAKRKGNA